jgi:hypothetical protein
VGESLRGGFCVPKAAQQGERRGTFSAKNCLKEKIWNKYKKICKNC